MGGLAPKSDDFFFGLGLLCLTSLGAFEARDMHIV